MTNITINSLPTANTIDPTQDILPIYTASGAATQGINRNTLLGLSSAPVGLTDSQTLTNKVLTSPTINGATLSGTLSGTYTIGGTPTFPSSVATLTGSQTLTNKVLTSPTINSPTITNATLSADTISGYTTSNTGTIYGGISVSTGNVALSGNLAVTGTTSLTGKLTTSAFIVGTPPVWQYLGYAQVTSSTTGITSSTPAQVTGLTSTVTIPSGVTKVKITVWAGEIGNTTTSQNTFLSLWDGVVNSGTELAFCDMFGAAANVFTPAIIMALVAPGAGSKTYNVGIHVSGGSGSMTAAATKPAFILVECC